MGLLGLFATLFTGGNFLKDTIKEGFFNAKSKENAIRDEQLSWMDWHGNRYMVSDGEKVFSHDGKLISVKTGNIVVDVKKENIKKYNQQKIKEAESEGIKWAELRYIEYNERIYLTELSTMRRYYLVGDLDYQNGKGRFKKYYFKDGELYSWLYSDEQYEVTKEEFDSLYGGVYRYEFYHPHIKKCGIHEYRIKKG